MNELSLYQHGNFFVICQMKLQDNCPIVSLIKNVMKTEANKINSN